MRRSRRRNQAIAASAPAGGNGNYGGNGSVALAVAALTLLDHVDDEKGGAQSRAAWLAPWLETLHQGRSAESLNSRR